MKGESSGVREALSECGLFKDAETEERASAAEAPAAPLPSRSDEGSPSGSILEALDRILPARDRSDSEGGDAADEEPERPRGALPSPAASEVAASEEDAPSIDESLDEAEPMEAPSTAIHERILDALAGAPRAIHLDAVGDRLRMRLRGFGLLTESGALDRVAFETHLRRAAGLAADVPFPPRLDWKIPSAEAGFAVEVDTLATGSGVRFVLRPRHDAIPDSLEDLGADSATAGCIRAALARPAGGLLAIGVRPGDEARDTLLALALEQCRAGRLVVSLVGGRFPGDSDSWIAGPVPSAARRADAFEAALRHDPDVLVAGRIASADEASRALRAAREGVHVLAAVPARGAADAPAAFRALGADSFALAAAEPCFAAQVRVRALCSACREPAEPGAAKTLLHGLDAGELRAASVYRGVGCARCQGGYLGRLTIVEVLDPPAVVAGAVREGVSAKDLEARSGGTRLRALALRAVAQGRTTVEEALRSMV